MMLARILIASSLVTGSFAVAPVVFGQALTYSLKGKILEICTEQVNSPGTLAPDGGLLPNRIAASFSGGALANIQVNCNVPGTITVDSVTPIAAPDTDPGGTLYFVFVYNRSNSTSANGRGNAPGGGAALGSPIALISLRPGFIGGGINNLEVDLIVDRGSAGEIFLGGNYTYEAQFTIAP